MENIKENYQRVIDNVINACDSSGRSKEEVQVITVSKKRSFEVIEAALKCGINNFGENYPEEALDKIIKLGNSDVMWHMIGHIQSRKTKYVSQYFNMIHSIDRLKVCERINNELIDTDKVMPILLEINVSGEYSKHGWSVTKISEVDNIRPDIEKILTLKNIRIEGLMTMPPLSIAEDSRIHFSNLRKIQEYLSKIYGNEYFHELSMGTSHDYEVAINEGATYVRIGEAILGKR